MSHTCVILPLVITVTAFAQTGAIHGIVDDNSGQPVAGAYAVATLQSASSRSTSSARTGAAGDFTLSNLLVGRYSICVQVAGGSPHLNPCQWAAETQVDVTSGQTANQNITVTKGSQLQIRVNDPNRILTATDDLLVGIYPLSGPFQPMRLAASDPTGRTYDVAVPKSTSVRVAVTSLHLLIADDKGHALGSQAPPRGNSAPPAATSAILTLPGQSGVNGPPVTLTIAGRK